MAAIELNSTSLVNDSTLKAYYRFVSGSLTTDSSGEGHTLTAISDPADDASGAFGNAVALDGNDAYSHADHADFKPTGNFTVGCWVKTSTTGVNQVLVSSFSLNTNWAGWFLQIFSDNKVYFNSGKNTGTVAGVDRAQIGSSGTYTDGAWHFIVGTWDGTKIHLYIDGSEQGTGTAWTYAPAYAATNYVRVGCRNDTGTNLAFLTGSLDDVFIFNGTALSADTIASIYDGTINSPSTSPSISISSSLSSSPSISVSTSPSTSLSTSPSISISSSPSTSPSSSPSTSPSTSPSISISSSISSSPSAANVLCDSYSESNVDDYYKLSSSDYDGIGQSFTGDGGILDSVKFYLQRVGSPTGNVYAKIYAHSGVYGTSSVPTGAALATSEPLDENSIGTSPALVQFNFSGGNKITLTNLTNYIVAVEYGAGDSSNYYNVGADSTSPTHGGNLSTYDTGSWSAVSTYDAAFYVYVDEASSISASPSVSSSPSVSTSISSSPSTSPSISISSSPSISISTSVSSSPSNSISSSPSSSPSISISSSLSSSPSSSVSSSPSISISSSPSTSPSISISTSPSSSVSSSQSGSISISSSPSGSPSSSPSTSLSSSPSSSASSSPSPTAENHYRSIGKPNQPLYRDINRPL